MPFGPFNRQPSNTADPGRVPPGQTLTTKFPVLHIGDIPSFDGVHWDFKVFGAIEHELIYTWEEFRRLPSITSTSDFHCVTGWSRLDNTWEGVSFRALMALAVPKPEAAFVIAHCYGGYTTNISLSEGMKDNVLLSYRFNHAELAPEHGGPLRLVVPALYGYKSAKWLQAIEISPVDKPGFWEVRGYSNHADPWKEERFAR